MHVSKALKIIKDSDGWGRVWHEPQGKMGFGSSGPVIPGKKILFFLFEKGISKYLLLWSYLVIRLYTCHYVAKCVGLDQTHKSKRGIINYSISLEY